MARFSKKSLPDQTFVKQFFFFSFHGWTWTCRWDEADIHARGVDGAGGEHGEHHGRGKPGRHRDRPFELLAWSAHPGAHHQCALAHAHHSPSPPAPNVRVHLQVRRGPRSSPTPTPSVPAASFTGSPVAISLSVPGAPGNYKRCRLSSERRHLMFEKDKYIFLEGKLLSISLPHQIHLLFRPRPLLKRLFDYFISTSQVSITCFGYRSDYTVPELVMASPTRATTPSSPPLTCPSTARSGRR